MAYKGRGVLHLTWKNNYRDASAGLNAIYGTNYDLVTNYLDVSDNTTIAARTGAWFWQSKGLNAAADRDDIDKTTIVIHGPGASDRDIRHQRWADVINPIAYDTNGYGNIRNLTNLIGINSINSNGYEGKFGIQLDKRTAVKISAANERNLESTSLVIENNEDLLSDTLTDWMSQLSNNETTKEVDMLLLDHSSLNIGSNFEIIAQSNSKSKNTINVGICYLSDTHENKSQPIAVDPMHLRSYGAYGLNHRNAYQEDDILFWFNNAQAQVLQNPAHGALSGPDFYYRPNPGFAGNDQIVYLVTGQGPDGKTHSVKLTYFVKVIKNFTKRVYQSDLSFEDMQKARTAFCGGRPEAWPLPSGQVQGRAALAGVPVTDAQDVAAWLQSAQLSSLIASATQSLTGFANLPGTTVGITAGQGTSAHITLDTDAAGHGWYVDETPLDNTDDYLPTSDPTLWKAKAGSAADGKMDLLSVLLHEYGHALGLEHSADARDFMGASLQAGERRLPSAQELQLMAKLVAQLKEEPTAGDQPGTPPPQPSDFPSNTPAPLALAGLLGARRKSGAGSEQLIAPQTLNKLISVNPTLQNGEAAA